MKEAWWDANDDETSDVLVTTQETEAGLVLTLQDQSSENSVDISQKDWDLIVDMVMAELDERKVRQAQAKESVK